MNAELFKFLSGITENISIRNYLDRSVYDELIEIDLEHDTFRMFSHIENKYFLPELNDSYSKLLDYIENHIIVPDYREFYVSMMHPKLLKKNLEKSPISGLLQFEFQVKVSDGSTRWVEEIVLSEKQYGKDNILRAYVIDIQNKKSREIGFDNRTVKNVSINKLTGLLNQSDFFSALTEKVKTIPDNWCLIAIDIENFKLFNEWYGRKQGDVLLSQIGDELNKLCNLTDGLAGYFGHDDFCLVAPYNKDKIKKLYEYIHGLVIDCGTSVGFWPAFGISMFEPGVAMMDLFDRASKASNFAKENYKSRIRVFDPSMYKQTELEYHILSDFQQALHNGDIVFYLQPQCRISDKKIVGAEALVRWIKPDGRIVPPLEFIPTLEKCGASGLLRFYKSDGSLSHFLTRLYYIGETDNEQRFYGSVQDITEFTQLQNNMKLLSDYSSDTVVFLTKGLKTSSFKVIINGLEQYTGLDSKELEAELNSGFFFKRIANDDHKEKIKKISKESRQNGEGFAFSFSIKNNNGKNIDLYLKTDPVKDCFSLVEYILVFRTPLKT